MIHAAVKAKRTNPWIISSATGGSGSGNVVRGMAAALEEEREAAAAAAMGRNVERRKWKAEQKELLDDMLPPAPAGTRWKKRVSTRMHVFYAFNML